MTSRALNRVRVSNVSNVATQIKRFELVSADGRNLPPFSPGAHVIVTMRNGEHVWRNPYSIVCSAQDQNGYVISVQRSPESRGGSVFMHTVVEKGTELEISDPVNLFPVAHTACKHILIAGGIGITPMLAMLDQFKKNNTNFELHYAVRAPDVGAYYADLATEPDVRVCVYRSDNGQRIPLADILSNQPLGTHLYVCGPERLIEWAIDVAKHEGWPDENVHWERFSTPPPGDPFTVELASTGQRIEVGEHQSALEAIEQAGIDAPYLCRGGACGQCVTKVISVDGGVLLHNDHYLTDDEKKNNSHIAICVSRTDGCCVKIDL